MSQTPVVPNCPNPKCGVPISIENNSPWCNVCGQSLDESTRKMLAELRALNAAKAKTVSSTSTSSTNENSPIRRYIDLYRAARGPASHKGKHSGRLAPPGGKRRTSACRRARGSVEAQSCRARRCRGDLFCGPRSGLPVTFLYAAARPRL